MLFGIIVICSVLIALQFPAVMSSPLTALGFAALITCSLGTVAAVVGETVAPLPLFALILVSLFGFLCQAHGCKASMSTEASLQHRGENSRRAAFVCSFS